MLTHRNLCTLWLLLILHGSGNAMRFNLFRKPPPLQDGDIRLSGSGRASEGRVEVYHEGKWGTICDDGWDMAEAKVVCRQLEFPGAKSVVNGHDYGKGTNTTIDDSIHPLDHSISLSDELGQIFDSRKSCDFHIVAQSATGNRKEDGTPEIVETDICAHKLIVSQFPHFNASEESTSVTVSISESCQPYFTSLIRYIYTRKIDVSFTSAQCFHWMASEFRMKQLMEDTGRLFTKILPEDASFQTQVSLYKYAEKTGDLVLQENCIQFLAWNYQNLTASPAWTTLPDKLLGAILARSDLVVHDEYFLLETVESWIKERGNSISLETQVDLLNGVRFPMIPAEKLYDLESKSSLYSTFTNLYRENMLKAFQFNFLLLSKLQSNSKFNEQYDDYKPRIYTSEAWSTVLGPLNLVQNRIRSSNRRNGYNSYAYPTSSPYAKTTTSFTTSVHNSLILKDKRANWQATVFKEQRDCSNWGIRCESVPAVRLVGSYNQQSNILFRNRLLLMCQGKYICQVQDFKENVAYIPKGNETQTAYPCPDDQYVYHFVVRPEYV
ncbi:galectin-3-binding protein A-like isoform X2 [Notolabrus celidotus]|uniref:galectin-3-binding protein A-like isoform X2 n=1 Tax=Notolabrus celidotus TaxID=1203425 RepID=UPI00148FD6D8|nr:galectin-3-binding protein A-like isoform X2 [Notolabrus celidotus]